MNLSREGMAKVAQAMRADAKAVRALGDRLSDMAVDAHAEARAMETAAAEIECALNAEESAA